MSTRYVVALNRKEAESLAEEIGHRTMADAMKHLRVVRAPPTDPHYARQYAVYQVEVADAVGESEED